MPSGAAYHTLQYSDEKAIVFFTSGEVRGLKCGIATTLLFAKELASFSWRFVTAFSGFSIDKLADFRYYYRAEVQGSFFGRLFRRE